MKLKIRAAVVLAVSIAAICSAESLLRGDLVAGTRYIPIMCPAPPAVWVFSDRLALKKDVFGSGKIAVDGVGRIYVLSDVTPFLDVLDTQFQRIRYQTLLEPSSSFTVDETGRAFIVGESGLVRIYSPEGTLLSTFPLPNVVTPVRDLSIDIAPDGCTLVYIGGPNRAAERYDLCSGTALPAVGSGFDAVRALRDGGIAGAIVGRIEFFDRTGRLVSDQPAPTADRITAIAFGADGTTMFVAAASKIFEMRVGVPAVSAQATIDLTNILALAVFGEQRPATSPAEPRRRSVRH